jgi:hypothetical protein
MSRTPVSPEPISSEHEHHHHTHGHHGRPAAHRVNQTRNTLGGAQPRPADVEALVRMVQRQFPQAHIRITSRGRTVHEQARLMAERRRANRSQFLGVYKAAAHITEMDKWVTAHPNATKEETIAAFEDIINRALQKGAAVSNHLSDRARDVSIPIGGPNVQRQVRDFIKDLGGRVLDEHDAVGGPHWHVDY